MTSGGLYIMITNAGEMDEYLYQQEDLDERIQKALDSSSEPAEQVYSETINYEWLSESHLVPFEEQFEPYIQFGPEYWPVQETGGEAGASGGKLDFSLPVYGDLINDIVFETDYSETSTNAGTLPDLPYNRDSVAATGDIVQETVALPGGTTIDTVDLVGKKFRTIFFKYLDTLTGEFLVPATAAPLSPQTFTDTHQDFVRWCEFPGERQMDNVEFDVNGNPMDEYNKYAYSNHRQFFVSEDKKRSYEEIVGQEEPKKIRTCSNGGSYEEITYFDGLETPKLEHDSAKFITPLLFWFNKCLSESFVSAAIPYGERFIHIDLAKPSDLVRKAARFKQVAFVYEHTYTGATAIIQPTPGEFTFPSGAIEAVLYNIKLTRHVAEAFTNGTVNYPVLSSNELKVRNIFLDSTLHQVYMSKIFIKMIKVHKEIYKTISDQGGVQDIQITELKFPIEYMMFGIEYPDDSHEFALDHWYRHTSLSTEHKVCNRLEGLEQMLYQTKYREDDVVAGATSDYLPEKMSHKDLYNVKKNVIPITKVGVGAQEIDIVRKQPWLFYHAFHVYWAKGQIRSQDDEGLMLVSFSETPGNYEPLGHFDASRSRELVLSLEIDESLKGKKHILNLEACAINFLYMSNGNAVIRFSA